MIATGLIPVTELVVPATAEIGALTVKETVAVVLAIEPTASVTLNTTLAVVYVAVGVPDTTLVLVLRVTPVGNVPETIP